MKVASVIIGFEKKVVWWMAAIMHSILCLKILFYQTSNEIVDLYRKAYVRIEMFFGHWSLAKGKEQTQVSEHPGFS